jgi:hypothetical protein
VGNRMFHGSDFMVHRRANYTVTVKAFSTRMANTECLNSENTQVRTFSALRRNSASLFSRPWYLHA